MKEKLICTQDGLDFPVKLYQISKHRYKVVYGADVRTNLRRWDAAAEFGYCVFHSAECAGKLDVWEDE